jgi:hypothetical protein
MPEARFSRDLPVAVTGLREDTCGPKGRGSSASEEEPRKARRGLPRGAGFGIASAFGGLGIATGITVWAAGGGVVLAIFAWLLTPALLLAALYAATVPSHGDDAEDGDALSPPAREDNQGR